MTRGGKIFALLFALTLFFAMIFIMVMSFPHAFQGVPPDFVVNFPGAASRMPDGIEGISKGYQLTTTILFFVSLFFAIFMGWAVLRIWRRHFAKN